MGKILQIFLKLNFTPNTFGCYGLILAKKIKWNAELFESSYFFYFLKAINI